MAEKTDIPIHTITPKDSPIKELIEKSASPPEQLQNWHKDKLFKPVWTQIIFSPELLEKYPTIIDDIINDYNERDD